MDDRDAIRLAQSTPLTLSQAQVVIAQCQALGVDPFKLAGELPASVGLAEWVKALTDVSVVSEPPRIEPANRRYPDASKRR